MKTNMSFEQFQQFLKNLYGQLTGESFISDEVYTDYVKRAIKYIGVDVNRFLSATLLEIKLWQKKLEDSPAFHSLTPKYRRNIISGYKAYITCLRYKHGFIKVGVNQ